MISDKYCISIALTLLVLHLVDIYSSVISRVHSTWRDASLASHDVIRRFSQPCLPPHYELWRDFPYEYEFDRLAIDLINGSELLRQWVDDPGATPDDLDALARPDEVAWLEEMEAARLYA